MEEVFVLMKDSTLYGIYSSYKKAVHAIVVNAEFPICDFSSQFGVDLFTDNVSVIWSIESKTMDKM